MTTTDEVAGDPAASGAKGGRWLTVAVVLSLVALATAAVLQGITIYNLNTRVRTLSSVIVHQDHGQPSGQFFYLCRRQPCKDSQVFTVFDGAKSKSPILTVPLYGGPTVLGDKFAVVGTLTCNRVTRQCMTSHEVVISPWSPAGYQALNPGWPIGCVPPALWMEPTGFWACDPAGTWIQWTP